MSRLSLTRRVGRRQPKLILELPNGDIIDILFNRYDRKRKDLKIVVDAPLNVRIHKEENYGKANQV